MYRVYTTRRVCTSLLFARDNGHEHGYVNETVAGNASPGAEARPREGVRAEKESKAVKESFYSF